ncbi:DUF2142 domain-containing protein [Cellulomonas sp. Leaf395]|uniref:DUF2142 domain-containing protein n=1 Tax=Cellulomonas sp. Leaf395 TaxID=1736362 RepID=UPI0006F6C786|nr:DUF2142 domain-containing protein [Cellulomonas sp. Leaf395]KQS99777.1 hypothetical protein ASG23_10630 [Cellulomonas sp. Leaf395]
MPRTSTTEPETTDVEPATPHARRGFARAVRSGRTVSTVAVVLLILISAAVWLTRPAGHVQGVATQSAIVGEVSSALDDETVISQDVTATQDGLTAFSAKFGTYGPATDQDCAIVVTVTAPDGAQVDETLIPCGDIIDSETTTVVAEFDPLTDSAGQTYTVTFAAAPGDWDRAVALWVGEPFDDEPSYSENGEEADTTALVVAEYEGGTIASQIFTALDRAGEGGPWWVQPGALVVWTLLMLAGIVAAVNVSWTSLKLATVLVIAVALLRGLLWSALIPPLDGMDEGAHAGYAQFLAEEGRLPVRDVAYDNLRPTLSDQLAILNDFVAREGSPPSDRANRDPQATVELEQELREASPRANGSASAAGYPPAYYAPAAVLYTITPGTFLDKIYGMRLWTVLLGGLAAWATMHVTRRLLPRKAVPATLLGLAVVLQPMMAHQFAIVNNDGLVMAAGIAAFAMALRLAQGRFRATHVLAAGALVGAALLAKPYGVGIAPVVALGWIVGLCRDGWSWKRSGVQAAAGVLGVVATYGVWVVFQVLAAIPPSDLPFYPDGDQNRSPRHYLHLQFLDGLDSFRAKWGDQMFGLFSWLDVRLPMTAYNWVWLGLKVVVILAAVWLVVGAVRLVRRGLATRQALSGASADEAARPVAAMSATSTSAAPGSTVDELDRTPAGGAVLSNAVRTWMSAVCVVGVIAVLYLAGYLYFRNSGRDELLQGRYALMVVPALLALPALLVEGILPRRAEWWRRAALWVLPAAMFLGMWTLHVLSVATIGDRFYS